MTEKILITWEDEDYSNMLKNYFCSEFGYEVMVLDVPIHQISVIKAACLEHQPNILMANIFDDAALGDELCMAIKNTPTIQYPTIILFIKYDEKSVRPMPGLKYFADKYIRFPFDIEELGLKIQALMDKHHD